jgi:hypothetical protein
LTCIQFAKNKEDVIDLEAPLSTSAGRPVGNKAAKLAAIEATSSDMIQSSVDKFVTNVSTNFLIRKAKRAEQNQTSVEAR